MSYFDFQMVEGRSRAGRLSLGLLNHLLLNGRNGGTKKYNRAGMRKSPVHDFIFGENKKCDK